jgi:uncharacterized membrane protein
MKLISWLLILIVSFSMLGCSANVKTFDSTATLGQQMEDLEASYKAGAITEGEYNKAKNILIKRYK